MKINIEDLKKLREITGAGVGDCRAALEEAKGNIEEAVKILRKRGIEKAAKKSDREVKAGKVFSYVHHTGRIGSMVGLGCETDFVAKNEDFEKLGREIALQVSAAQPANIDELLEQEYVRDGSKKVSELIKETVGKLGENIRVVDIKIVQV